MQKIFVFFLVTLLLVCCPSSARRIQKMTKIDPIPELTEVPTARPKQLILNVDSDSSAYDPCKVSVLCRNNGVCESRGNEYYCKCPNTHYGKTCEFIANLKECYGNQCMNNSTCYRCWCKPGFKGAFCEFSEGMRRCSEDKCNHHGIVVLFDRESDHSEQEGLECKCHCEEGYFGDECEYVSPCRDFQCKNNGACKISSEDETAFCECPASIELFPLAKISGPHCEHIDDGGEQHSCFPCQEGQNFTSFLDCLEDRASISRADLQSLWWADCEAENANCLADLEQSFCFNGTCQPVISRLPSMSFLVDEKLFLLPKCQCQKGFTGNFCERKVQKSCDPVCVHGNCCDTSCYNNLSVLPKDGKVCKCVEGYKGERCELKDPCYSNPCGEALCVELVGDGVREEVPFTCICKTSQGISEKSQECVDVHYDKCKRADGSSFCINDGNCYPCSIDKDRNLQLCSDFERRRGFRCLCPPGLKQPFAKTICECPLGYSGSFCETLLGICLRNGATCVNSVCVEDINTRRRFRCECDTGFYGYNCEKKNEGFFIRVYSPLIYVLTYIVQVLYLFEITMI